MSEVIVDTIKESNIASQYLTGRRTIWTSIERFDPRKQGEMIAELNSSLSIHTLNLIAMDYLYWYRRGVTPIYAKTKVTRDEINHMVNVPIAEEVCNFKNGYFMTQPCFYVSRKEGNETTDKVNRLNEYLYRSGKQTADNKMVDWFHTVGKADLFVQSNDDDERPFVAYALDPRSAFVAKSLKPDGRPVYAVHTVTVDEDKIVLDVWDDTYVYTVMGTYKGSLATPYPDYFCNAVNVIDIKPNPLKRVPIIEYYYNSVQMGAFEAVIPLLDAISYLQSDRLDGVDQFINSLLVFYNCELGQDEDGNDITPQFIRAMGAVFLKTVGDNKADLKEIVSQLDQSQTQIFIDNLYQQVLAICGMPVTGLDRGYSNAATQGAQLTRDGWYQADSSARNTEDLFLESNREFDEIVTSILREKNLLDIKTTDFALQFVRNETVNIQAKAQAFQTLLAAGMHPELAAKKSGVSNDPVADMKMSEKYLKMIWGDPDNPIGEEAELYENEDPNGEQARADERLSRGLQTAKSNNDGIEGTRSYTRVQNGRKVQVRGYKKTKKQEVQ